MTRLVKNNCQVCFCARARSFVHAPGRIRSEKLRLIPRMCTCSGAGFGTSSEPNGDQVFVVPSDLHVSALQAPKVMSIFAYVQDLLSCACFCERVCASPCSCLFAMRWHELKLGKMYLDRLTKIRHETAFISRILRAEPNTTDITGKCPFRLPAIIR